MSNEEASSSQSTKRPKRRKVDCSGYCGLTEEEVNSILSLVDEDIYLSDVSEEDPFLDSGSEYCPSSEDSESDLDELEPENEQENQQEEVGNVEDNITHPTVLEIIWTKNEFLPKIHEFDTTNSGVKDQNLDENSKEVDYFLSLFTENIVDVILDETNNYARQQNAKNWKHLERSEFYVFLALTLLMPRNKKVNLKEYWSQNHLLLSPAFSKHMSRDRYGIVKSIHCDLGNARLQNRHFPVSVPRKPGSTKVGSRRCWVCSHTKQKQAKRKESSYMCPECDVGLCVVPCYKIYHTEATF
ncbi:unnamed protein product [Acanthoscelides obtectus]|uniref:PiggyBac transposable element-derived protein domain-containing protein n=1 Tax=Acanthoscelides obtectus TaxID=200917 RepID=A0A9P0LR64_ACAOB|nr:unnamed protein product [Acanthoscelides obtectus]CAK1686349.1 PiggyBac transposable element-derived protein 4 [Acanthoscelides obtectus]